MSDIHFNDPNFHPSKFNPLRPKISPGMTFEEHQRIVQAGLKKMKLPRERDLSDVEALLKEARSRINLIRQYLLIIDNEVRAQGKDHDRKLLWQDLHSKFLENFSHYGKDELLIILSTFLTEMGLKEVV